MGTASLLSVMYDLLICIRCHDKLKFVVDTYQAAQAYTSSNTEVVFAVDDGDSSIGKKMMSMFGPQRVYLSRRRWGWGAGLFCLLIESYKYFRDLHSFHHFQSIDYDTLFIGPEVDRAILDRITSEQIGLLGCHKETNEHWKTIYERDKEKFHKTFGPASPSYNPGEGVQGGCMVLTETLLQRMESRGMLNLPFTEAKKHTNIADDHLLPIFVRMCELDIVNISKIAHCHWNAKRDPRGLEKKGVKVFHPTKLRANNPNASTEIEIRNYFRQVRKAPDLLR